MNCLVILEKPCFAQICHASEGWYPERMLWITALFMVLSFFINGMPAWAGMTDQAQTK